MSDFGGREAQIPYVRSDCHDLAHYYATDYYHSFISQILIYIIVSSSDEHSGEVPGDIPLPIKAQRMW